MNVLQKDKRVRGNTLWRVVNARSRDYFHQAFIMHQSYQPVKQILSIQVPNMDLMYFLY